MTDCGITRLPFIESPCLPLLMKRRVNQKFLQLLTVCGEDDVDMFIAGTCFLVHHADFFLLNDTRQEKGHWLLHKLRLRGRERLWKTDIKMQTAILGVPLPPCKQKRKENHMLCQQRQFSNELLNFLYFCKPSPHLTFSLFHSFCIAWRLPAAWIYRLDIYH